MRVHQRERFHFDRYAFEEFEIDPPADVECARIGIDPGTVNMGVAILAPERSALLYQIKMERDDDPMGRMRRVKNVLARIFFYFEPPEFHPLTIIEGASFGDRYRQAELAEQRAAVALWLSDRYAGEVKFVPPSSIRKQVFGSTKTSAWVEWPDIPKDAACALAAALVPAL